tara:strand:- start:365 stop:643 length:279 start_codon:yes stop_codon:yes gene_type:complete
MYYTEEDMIKGIPVINNVTLFERHTCRAMAFGDNLALSATFVTLANGLNELQRKTTEANDNKSVTGLSTLSTESEQLAVALMQSLSAVLHEV